MSQEDYKKDSRKGLENGEDKGSFRKGPRFSIYWIYAIVAIFLIGYQVLKGVTPDARDITELTFRQEMLANNDVATLNPSRNKT